jgi:predicted RNase H-like HicB family nuclease
MSLSPAIPGCHSQGDTIEEAIENMKDAIRGCLEALDVELLYESADNKHLVLEVAI